MASAASPERESEETEEASTSQPRQHRNVDTRDEGGTIAPCNGLQRNLLAQYKSDSEGSRMRAQGAQGAIGPSFGRGQPLQPLPEGSPSPFQVCVLTWARIVRLQIWLSKASNMHLTDTTFIARLMCGSLLAS